MTKKHFKALAETLHRNKAFIQMNAKEGQSKELFDRITYIVGDVCAEINDRFDYQRFTDACNGRPYKR